MHTNERWLARILRSERFLTARHSVAFLQESGSDLQLTADPPASALILAALVAAQGGGNGAPGPWDITDGFTPNLPATVGFAFRWRKRRYEVDLVYGRDGPVRAVVDDAPPLDVADIALSGTEVAVRLSSVLLRGHYHVDRARLHLWVGSEHFDLLRDDPRDLEYSASAASGGLTTPLPGVVVAVSVKPGQQVAAGDVLMVVEAMKMEHTITAPRAGTVKAIHCAPGDRVPEGKALLELT